MSVYFWNEFIKKQATNWSRLKWLRRSESRSTIKIFRQRLLREHEIENFFPVLLLFISEYFNDWCFKQANITPMCVRSRSEACLCVKIDMALDSAALIVCGWWSRLSVSLLNKILAIKYFFRDYRHSFKKLSALIISLRIFVVLKLQIADGDYSSQKERFCSCWWRRSG